MELQSNPELELAYEYVCHTNRNIFLTGKAGTGKTTFLRRIKHEPVKRMAVVAPTGVAAINAGGMTIHSFFQLPFGPYVPGNSRDANRQRKFSREKIRLIKSLDLLVIDEISMVRADLLDGIDEVLRRYKNPYQPFGGVQLLLIGDLHQLPPVVKDDEWNLLREHYDTPYFFGSRALEKTAPVVVQLTHIFRQSDRTFIELLNRVRENRLDETVLETLNSRYIPGFEPSDDEGYITLTTHNATAQTINAQKLAAAPGAARRFSAAITGDFPAQAYPTDETLELKPGAQVMFVKNDASPEKRFFNGKIGRITRIDDDTITVQCPGDDDAIAVARAVWENIRYTLNEKTREVDEEVIGTFTQFPLKLAWAITIHKSQGLTFERVVLDAQAAFAHGQVYVALSRCKSFEGLVLRTRIATSSVRTDMTVQDYSETAGRNAPTPAHLQQAKAAYQQALIFDLFDFSALKKHLERLERLFLEHENTLNPEAGEQLQALRQHAAESLLPVADKFRRQLLDYFDAAELPENSERLQARLHSACAWFLEQLGSGPFAAANAIRIVTDNKAVDKLAREALENLQKELAVKQACFADARDGFSTLRYLRTKANAELDFQAAASASPASARTGTAARKLPHPGLYAQLLEWREATANTANLEPYQVLLTKTLVEIVRTLPTRPEELKTIKGIGKVKLRQFGPELLAIVHEYCRDNNLPHSSEPAIAFEEDKPVKPDTKALSLDLFRAGKSIDEIAAERGFVRSTIESHLAHFVGLGELDLSDLMTEEDIRNIEAFFSERQTTSSAEAKAHFGEKYSYGEIKLVLAWMAAQGRE